LREIKSPIHSPSVLIALKERQTVRTALLAVLLGCAFLSTDAYSSRIAIWTVDSTSQFYHAGTGQRFAPRGNNYVKLAAQTTYSGQPLEHHSTFSVGLYNPGLAEQALSSMESQRYNTVRVFLSSCCTGGIGNPAGGVSPSYVANLADFLRRALSHGIWVVIAATLLPEVGGYQELVGATSAGFGYPNSLFLTSGGVQAYQQYWRDVVRELQQQRAPLEAILGYELFSEAHFDLSQPPFNQPSGLLQTANGKTYDLSDPVARQLLQDENLIFFANQVRGSIRAEDQAALVTLSTLPNSHPHPSPYLRSDLAGSTYPVLARSDLDFISIHPYAGLQLSLSDWMENLGIPALLTKPLVMTEFGIPRVATSSPSLAGAVLHRWQSDSCRFGVSGWMLWTWDTQTQPDGNYWFATAGDGVVDRALSPRSRPDPCVVTEYAGQITSLGRPAVGSLSRDGFPPGLAVDGRLDTSWQAGASAPQWFEVPLDPLIYIRQIEMVIAQYPNGPTVHRVWAVRADGSRFLLKEFAGVTSDGETLVYKPLSPLDGLTSIRIETVQSPSWVAWREVIVESAGPPTAITLSRSTLNFPRFVSVSELAFTGFAIVNPNRDAASVIFSLYSTTGWLVARNTQTYAGGTQRALLGSELFPTAPSGGWVQASSDSPDLHGFWMNYDGALTSVDGAEAADSAVDLVIPFVAGETELNIVNPGPASQSVTLRLYGEAGVELATSVDRAIASHGVLQESAAVLFPAADINNARYVRVTASAHPVTATAMIGKFLVPSDKAVINGVDRASMTYQAAYPHVVSGVVGGGNYTTVIAIANLARAWWLKQQVTISFMPQSGGAPLTITREIPVDGAIQGSLQSLFSLDPSRYYDGWIQITGTAPFAAVVAYADTVAGGLAVVPAGITPHSTLLFAHLADLPPWCTGIAMLNPNSVPAIVRVYAMTPEGRLIGGADDTPTSQFTLPPNSKLARLLSELIPQTQSRSSDSGFIYLSSTQPVHGIELFFTRSLNVLSNVAGGVLSPAAAYRPPTALGGPPRVTLSLEPRTVAVGQPSSLSWSAAGADSCLAIGDWAGSRPVQGTSAVVRDTEGSYTYTLTCSGPGGTASASETLAALASLTEDGIRGLATDITPALSLAGTWRPVDDRFIDRTQPAVGVGAIANTYAGNLRLSNGREGLALTGWSFSDFNNSATAVTPVSLALLEQQPDGTMQVATSKYISDPETNGGANVLVADFNKDGSPDLFLPAHNESPKAPASSTAYLSTGDGLFAKISIADRVEAHGAYVATLNGNPTVYTGSYYTASVGGTSYGNTVSFFNGQDFTVVHDTGVSGTSSLAVGDFLGDGEYSAVYGDFTSGLNYNHNLVRRICLYRLTNLLPAGTPTVVGKPYFDGKPQYASHASYMEFNKQHSSRIWLDDFNHDGLLDIVVMGQIWAVAGGQTKNILQMFQNEGKAAGNFRFADVTDYLNPSYDQDTEQMEYMPQSRDIDGSGVNSYFLGTYTYDYAKSPGNYLLVNDGTGFLGVALHHTLNAYARQVLSWLERNSSPSSRDYLAPAMRAYVTPEGLVNYLAISPFNQRISETPEIRVRMNALVNVPIRLDIARHYNRPMVVRQRNGTRRIRTFAGNDTIYFAQDRGRCTIDGGLGFNTVVYAGPSANYSVTRNSDGSWTVRDNLGDGGTDTLVNIQRLLFSDAVTGL
jgi:hypothetical protein